MTLSDANFLKSKSLFFGFISGAQNVIQQQEELNKINVFPVADSDTGTNLGNTFSFVINGIQQEKYCSDLLRKIADSAVDGAKGNSGVIIAQFFHGLSRETADLKEINLSNFAEALKKSVKRMYEAVSNPVEGTILTVIREWSEYLYEKKESSENFLKIFEDSLRVAQISLNKTTQKMEVLRKANLVDAGAKGFVIFLEGVMDFLKTGKVNHEHHTIAEAPSFIDDEITSIPKFRYCTEGLITKGENPISLQKVKSILMELGNSVALAGGDDRLHFHVHTNEPDRVINFFIENKYEIKHHKADDMLIQYKWKYENKQELVLVTDSTSDLPQNLRDEYQIYQVPFTVMVDGVSYLDRQTIQTSEIYDIVQHTDRNVTTSLVSQKFLKSAYKMGLSVGKKVIAIHTSSGLSGTYQAAEIIRKNIDSKDVYTVDSLTATGAEGLLVLRIAKALKAGASSQDILGNLDKWKAKSKVFVSISTLKYFLKSGRMSPMKGLLASIMNVKPLVSIDEKGKGTFVGKAFSKKGGIRLLKRKINQELVGEKIWGYTVTHTGESENLNEMIDFMKNKTGMEATFINETTPAIGIHAGPGCVCVCLMKE